jgi:hypothetical protein
MIVAIPILAIFKIICDEVEFLRPFGFLLGRSEKKAVRNSGKKSTAPHST